MGIRIKLGTCVVLFSSLFVTAQDTACSTLVECETDIIEQGLKREHDKYGMTRDDSRLANEVRSLGVDVTPMLVDLLEHQSFAVRRLAAYTLIGIPEIDKKYFSQISAALDTTPWLVRALGRIDSAEAAQEAVKRYSNSSSAPHNGEANAVKLSGERAIPFIIELIKCSSGCPENYVYNFGVLLSEMDIDKNVLVEEISKVITDESLSDKTITGAINILSFLRKDAISAEPMLKKLLIEKPILELAINNALVRLGTNAGINLIISSIAKEPTPYKILELVKNGHKAKAAAPVLLQLLEQGNSELKELAARALGFIGNLVAEEALISLLSNRNDVRLSVMAAQSLAQLKSERALATLELIKDEHWYPPVRNAAKDSIDIIKGHSKPAESEELLHSYYSMMDTPYFTQNICNNVPLSKVDESKNNKLYKSSDLDRLKTLSFDTHILSYRASDEVDQQLSGKEIIEVTEQNMVEHRTPLKQIPNLALKVENGWLTGSNRGEWGGELVFISDTDKPYKILSTNVEDIYWLGESVIATTGLSHLGINKGFIYKLAKDNNHQWSAIEWIKLPGSPQSSWFVETGELLINVLGGGSILLAQDGTMRMAPCEEG